MALAKRDEGKKVNSNINVTPMVDVMLVLLIIFMVITPMLQKGVAVDLPKTTNPREMQDEEKEDAVVVGVTRDSKVYLGSDQVSPADLGPKIRDKIEKKSDKTVFIRADARAKYGVVVDAIDNIRTAGVDQLGLITDQRQPLAVTSSAQLQ
jgi:biopolymer transport protein ExbD/biopolymer transport protein TolR